jgi:DNA-binding transcriptional LysR family regulator
VAETATLVSFVAAGLGVSLVPASVTQMTVAGAVYRPLSPPTEPVELAVAWRREEVATVVSRALHIVRREVPAAQAQPAFDA